MDELDLDYSMEEYLDLPEGEQIKAYFAWFGAALYFSNLIETAIQIDMLRRDFVGALNLGANSKHFGKKSIDYQTEFDSFVLASEKLTLGQLIVRFTAIPTLPKELKDKIKTAKARRNFLAHHFFRERAQLLLQPLGRWQCLVELAALRNDFKICVELIDDFSDDWADVNGWPLKKLHAFANAYVEETKVGNLASKTSSDEYLEKGLRN